jgi:hypothetical protein
MAIPRNLANIAPHVNASSTELVVNDGGADLDFRVEGDTVSNLLFVDASAEAVGIGSAIEANSKLTVKGAGIAISRDSEAVSITSAYDMKIRSASPKVGIHATGGSQDLTLEFSGGGSANAIIDVTSNDGLVFRTNNEDNARFRRSTGAHFQAKNAGSFPNADYHAFVQTLNESGLFIYASNASFTSNVINFQGELAAGATWKLLRGANSAAECFVVYGNGNVQNTNNSYGSLSDVKLKQDIVDVASQWDDIKNIRVRKFRFKNDPTGFLQIGVVAQELETVSPGLIEEVPDYEDVEVSVLDDEGNFVLNEDGEPQTKTQQQATGETTKAVKYSILYMKAVKALQEAMERIETLEAKVAALEAQ